MNPLDSALLRFSPPRLTTSQWTILRNRGLAEREGPREWSLTAAGMEYVRDLVQQERDASGTIEVPLWALVEVLLWIDMFGGSSRPGYRALKEIVKGMEK